MPNIDWSMLQGPCSSAHLPYSRYISRGKSFTIRPFCLFRREIIRGLDFEKKTKKNLAG